MIMVCQAPGIMVCQAPDKEFIVEVQRHGERAV
jgi:hypothetical protein